MHSLSVASEYEIEGDRKMEEEIQDRIDEMFREMIVENFKLEFSTLREEDLRYIEEMADQVLKEFNGRTIVDDDDVTPEIRDVLYLLEAMNVLKMDITEKHIIDGRVWRNHYWVMNERHFDEIMRKKKGRYESASAEGDAGMIYSRLPEEIWSRRNSDNFSGST